MPTLPRLCIISPTLTWIKTVTLWSAHYIWLLSVLSLLPLAFKGSEIKLGQPSVIFPASLLKGLWPVCVCVFKSAYIYVCTCFHVHQVHIKCWYILKIYMSYRLNHLANLQKLQTNMALSSIPVKACNAAPPMFYPGCILDCVTYCVLPSTGQTAEHHREVFFFPQMNATCSNCIKKTKTQMGIGTL